MNGSSCKTYLGDAVYADIVFGNCVVLTTEDGIRETNRIVLEPEVLAVLMAWISSLQTRRQRA